MLRFLADENFNGRIVRGLLRRAPTLDLVQLRDRDLEGASDPEVLGLAASEKRILLTHDVNTIPRFAYERVVAEAPMPGVFAIPAEAPIGDVIEDLLLLALVATEDECWNQVRYIPLQ